ncbi:MAG: MlaE family ABC transporter permease, partial [Bacteroidia bacterium]
MKVKNYAIEKSIKLSEKTLKRTEDAKSILADIGDLTIFAGRAFRQIFAFPMEFREFLRQCYQIGNKSLWLVAVTGFIMGLVLTIQSRPVLNEFGAEAMLPDMVAVSLIREIGPVITALICA